MLSLVIKESIDGGYDFYKVYNIDIETGEKITNKELLEYKSISSSELIKELPYIYGDYFKKLWGNSGDNFYNEQYKKTIAEKNCNIEQPMFIDGSGNINIVAKIYELAGGESPYSHIIKYEDKQVENIDNIKNEVTSENYKDYIIEDIEYMYVTNVVDNGENYTLQGEIYRRYIIEEEEFQRLKKGKTLIIGGTEYKYSKIILSGENISEIVQEGLVKVDGDDKEFFYDIVEFGENTYTILARATIMDVIQLTGEKKAVNVSKDKIVVLEPDSSTVGEYFKSYECNEEPTEYYPNSKYMYSFEYDENGECETVINVVTSM